MVQTDKPQQDITDTREAGYTERLDRLTNQRWKRLIDVQAPYRWNVRRLNLGRVLDIGCGLGRNLSHLNGNGVGVDHNETSVAAAREQGFTAYTGEEFAASQYATAGAFDALLAAHLLEHVSEDDARQILKGSLDYVRPGGRVVLICPQEVGYRSDASHIRWMGFEELTALCTEMGLEVERKYSFPLPRPMGKVFKYNEFVVVARKPAG